VRKYRNVKIIGERARGYGCKEIAMATKTNEKVGTKTIEAKVKETKSKAKRENEAK